MFRIVNLVNFNTEHEIHHWQVANTAKHLQNTCWRCCKLWYDISIVFRMVNLNYSNTEHEIHDWQVTNTCGTPAAGAQSSDLTSPSCSAWSI